MKPRPKPGILDITAYVGGRSPEPGGPGAIKLSSNESALGASPAAIAAYEAARAELSSYPEGSARVLRETVAEVHHLDPGRVVCGNGSDEILSQLAHAYLSPGDEVLFTEHAFLVYRIAAHANSAVPIAVPETNLRADVTAMLAAATPRTRLVYLANPNNPTGSCLSATEIRRLHDGLPDSTLLVIDAAYAEYVRRDDYEAGAELVTRFDNVVMTRTFSKIYGLAGLRVGWAFCPQAVADTLNRIRGPFNVSIPAQRAAAAALRDREHVARSIAHNAEWKSRLARNIHACGLQTDEGEGNFLLVRFASPQQAQSADAFLTARGFILRPVANYGLPHCLRLTIGSEEACRGVAAALADFTQQCAA
ncbi:MAG TPA: histidinol-phosphate transaminase [Rhizomicrobium sp.]|jgi:histidinol-phosphate aminotransferase|nr:histidinol-phosphate transaminase [Rhizomicrobium sp.]